MNCPKCGEQLPGKVKFCPECGFRMSNISSDEEPENFPLGSPADPSIMGRSHGAFQHQTKGQEPITVYEHERYTDHQKIGKGGFAEVYKAYDTKLDRTVAIKKLQKEVLRHDTDDTIIRRFRREARAVAKLRHLNIVNVYDQGTDDSGDYIVMEYIDQGSLEEVIRRDGVFQLEETLKLAVGICQGLISAHRQNLVHRDIKPANVLLAKGDDGLIPKIVDFGLVRAEPGSEVSESGYGMGTNYYMAPEQRRDAKSVNHTADIYSFGKTLYFMLTGEEPDVIDPEKINNTSLASVIYKCCKSNPAERYFTLQYIVEDIENAGKESAESSVDYLDQVGIEDRCPSCNTRNKEHVRFCAKCGESLVKYCPECSAENHVNFVYCGSCGTNIKHFEELKNALDQMNLYEKENNWNRIVETNSQLNEEMQFPGEKGKQLNSKREDIVSKALKNENNRNSYLDTIKIAIKRKQFLEALNLINKAESISMQDEWFESMKKSIEKEFWIKIQENSQGNQSIEDSNSLIRQCQTFLKLMPESIHAIEIMEITIQNVVAVSENLIESREFFEFFSFIDTCATDYLNDARVKNVYEHGCDCFSNIRNGLFSLLELAFEEEFQELHQTFERFKDDISNSVSNSEIKRLSDQSKRLCDLREQDIKIGSPRIQNNLSEFVSHLTLIMTNLLPDFIEIKEGIFRDRFGDSVRLYLINFRIFIDFIRIPDGSFEMGTDQLDYEISNPPHHVRVNNPVLIGKFPVTEKQYYSVMNAMGNSIAYLDHPITEVSWEEADSFCQKLAEVTGLDIHLPTEAQWEYGCRFNEVEDDELLEDLESYAWFEENSNSSTQPVGVKQPMKSGLHDMLGNVWEWCIDSWHDDYIDAPGTDEPWIDSNSYYRVIRGGAWCESRKVCSPVNRAGYGADEAWDFIGFRLVLEN